MTEGTRESLLAIKPKIEPLIIDNKTYYLRELTVGETNQAIYGQQKALQKLAEQQGIELNFDDPEMLAKQYSQLYDPYQLARTLATRLCDKNGVNLFDPENEQDLKDLSQLDKSVFEQFSQIIEKNIPKKSVNADDFN